MNHFDTAAKLLQFFACTLLKWYLIMYLLPNIMCVSEL